MSPTDATRGSSGTTAVPQRIFLSHTSDLGKPDQPGTFVAAAVQAVLRARHAVTDMAYFAARETSPAALCVDMVAQSDVYVGIIGLRYGSPVRDRPAVSYTELEFESAGKHNQPRLIFLIREDSTHLALADEPAERRVRQGAFRARLLDAGTTVAWVTSPHELELAVYQALVELAPTPDAPARLADAQALLASMPAAALPERALLPERAPLPAGSRMPLAPNPLFVGRGDELHQIARALRGGDTTVALGQVVASTGLGGLGKTQLAVELVHRYGRFFAGGVFWLSFANLDEVLLQVAACAGTGAVGLEADVSNRSLEERVKVVTGAWQSAVPRLLIFDNCEEEMLLEAWRPPTGGCRVLVTSRRSHWSPTLGVTAMPLDLLPRADSIELLHHYRSDLAADDPGLDAIAAELGDLPLALHLAGSYLRIYRDEVGLADYLAELRQPDVLQHASLLGRGLDDSPSPTHHVQSLAQTFAVSLRRLDRNLEVDQMAIALLARMACLAPGEQVPRGLLETTLDDAVPLMRADGLRRLEALGLVEKGGDWLRLHRLLAQFLREEVLDPQAQPAVSRTLIACGRAASAGYLTGVDLDAMIPHVIHAATAANAAGGQDEEAAELANAAGRVLQYGGILSAARPWYERARALRELVLGTNHLNTATSLIDLAGLLRVQGDLAAARPLLERARAITEQALGPGHLDAAHSLNSLALLLRDQGELTAAKPLFERVVKLTERKEGPNSANTVASLNNLALLLHAQGELASARAMLERVLEITKREQGPDHPNTAQSLHNLALVLRDERELAAARPMLERALAIRERVLALDHPDTAHTLHYLAILLWDQGELGTAQPLLERALAMRERVLGPNHPDTADSLHNLAGLLCAQGELGAATLLLERALGPDHPDAITSLNDWAILLRDRGELVAAQALGERALAICERVLGPDHPDTAPSLHILAGLLRDQGELTAARPLLERTLAICERVPGPDHLETATCLHNLALLLGDQGELTAAKPLMERALAICKRALGADHPHTARSLNDLALLHHAQGDLNAARAFYGRALDVRERVLGPDHPDTATSLHNLACLLRDQGDPAAARPLFERALAIRERVLGPDHPDTVATRRALEELAAQGGVQGSSD